MPFEVSFDEAKTAFSSIDPTDEESWYTREFEVDDPSAVAIADLEESPYKYMRIMACSLNKGFKSRDPVQLLL